MQCVYIRHCMFGTIRHSHKLDYYHKLRYAKHAVLAVLAYKGLYA